ncbi:fatty acid desaturase family protein [Undibacterium sp.]|uniref:fatty acid desaturase family protein n=1 Tax=Undibacterium sp. TaxID=1914977 RepID=UPI002C983C46|nr:fatty acid desaturase family protein [Undibacterium sp.]HTD02493.1 fatty acid desaturase family protein [Undibacterium sp.]
MAVAPRVNPEEFFTTDEWAALTARSSWKGLLLVAHCWLAIGVAMVVGALWPWTIPVAVLVIGTRQLGLFILMHDAAHAGLHRNRKVNDWVGTWLCSSSMGAYRPYHLQHHRYVQQSEDPDLVLSAPFPITRASLVRKIVRDLTGQTFVKQRFGHIAHRIKNRSADESVLKLFAEDVAKDRRFLIENGLGLLIFSIAGWWWVWVLMWLLPMMTWLPLVSRIRNIAEHALVAQNEADPLRQARTTYAGFVERILVAPYWVNYHGEHHMFTGVPCWNLPKAHRLLQSRGAAHRMEIQPGYISLLRLAAPA